MYWSDEGYLLSKNNFDENSIIVEGFTLKHGKCTGIIYGGSSRKQKRNFQIGNKILFNWISKGENRSGYFSTELIKPVSPFFFDDKKKSACILAATSILKILLPEKQINEKIYYSFEKLLEDIKLKNWIKLYINWELLLIKELGFEDNIKMNLNEDPRKALSFNRHLLMENFIVPNRLQFPLFRNILENYFYK
jgi:DNA repair protein RecO (recombination protein O)